VKLAKNLRRLLCLQKSRQETIGVPLSAAAKPARFGAAIP